MIEILIKIFILFLNIAAAATPSLSRKAASHKKFIEFQNRRTLSHEGDQQNSSSSSEDLKTMAEVR